MTPTEFYDHIAEIYANCDPDDMEKSHQHACDALCGLLKEFGYSDGVEFFRAARLKYPSTSVAKPSLDLLP